MKAPLIPADSFLIHYGNDGYNAEVVVGFEAAKRAFALLHGQENGDGLFEDMLDYVNDLDNWTVVDGVPVNLHVSDEGGYAEINRITFPEEQ